MVDGAFFLKKKKEKRIHIKQFVQINDYDSKNACLSTVRLVILNEAFDYTNHNIFEFWDK